MREREREREREEAGHMGTGRHMEKIHNAFFNKYWGEANKE